MVEAQLFVSLVGRLIKGKKLLLNIVSVKISVPGSFWSMRLMFVSPIMYTFLLCFNLLKTKLRYSKNLFRDFVSFLGDR